jgi:cell division protein ZapA
MNRSSTVTVSILDKEYQVACPPEEKHALIEAAQDLDRRMRVIRKSGKIVGLERIAVMAALNCSYELLQSPGASAPKNVELENDVKRIDAKIEGALQKFRQMEIG